jgi:hypothetical protein
MDIAETTAPRWYEQWRGRLQRTGPGLNDTRLEASARLATVLLCGEESAVRVFAREIERTRAGGELAAVAQLRAIERDELLHETALRAFLEQLPGTADQHGLKRRAQRFFAGLGRADTLAAHFGRIAHLDSAVCRIMWHIEKSALESSSPLRLLAASIKRDEAWHVNVSRRYAAGLGLDEQSRRDAAAEVRAGLVEMLEPVGSAFEVLGVDSDRLFSEVRRDRHA